VSLTTSRSPLVSTPPTPLTLPALPAWAQVTEKRRAHVARVTALLAEWAPHLARDDGEAAAMVDVGTLHDALRDAPEPLLRDLSGDAAAPVELLHGPAAAEMLAREGERRAEVLDAVRYHTIGHAGWGTVGRALYCADFLEPGRKFMRADRAFLAAHATRDLDGVFRQVVRMRIEWSLREGLEVFAETAALWNAVR
jgi:HD superfamily phosphohydrolase YqeK